MATIDTLGSELSGFSGMAFVRHPASSGYPMLAIGSEALHALMSGIRKISRRPRFMSTPENEFDLEKLFLPAWAQEPASAKYAHYEGEVERPDSRGPRRGPRPPRREGPRGDRRDDRRPREDSNRRGPERPGGPRGDRGDRERGRQGPGGRPPGGRGERRDLRERREPPRPLPEISLSFVPDEKGVESLSRQIRMTGRAYPLFDIAQMVLQKPERHTVVFAVKKDPEGKAVQPLFSCALDETLWLSEDEAVAHVLRKHFGTFYQADRTATEPPKGKYTFVAQCGMSGVILGPPNYHDYQNQLRKLHSERFSRMPFEVYKSRVKIVRDEEVVKKWVDDQSWKTDYVCLNLPEPLRLGNMEAVEKHFRETHKENIIKSVESCTLTGIAARNLRSPDLTRLVRNVWEDQRRFPLQIATVLSQQFASHGLQFFKVNKTITHVSVARPHYLDMEATPVSEGVKKIVDYINANPKCSRRKLVEAMAPSPAPAPIPIASPETPAAAPAPVPEANQPTPEQTVVIADLHWLIHQGHVIEFANGTLDTAKKPLPKPPKPQAKPEAEGGAQSESPVAAPEAEGSAPTTDAVATSQDATPPESPAQTTEPAPTPATNETLTSTGIDTTPTDTPSSEAQQPTGSSDNGAQTKGEASPASVESPS